MNAAGGNDNNGDVWCKVALQLMSKFIELEIETLRQSGNLRLICRYKSRAKTDAHNTKTGKK